MEGSLVTLGTIMKNVSETTTEALKKALKEDGVVASRSLIQSIRMPVKIFGDVFTMELWMEDYWKAVDKGTKPGTMPDVNKILKWMQHKGITPRATKTGLTRQRSKTGRKIFKDRRLVLAQKIAGAIFRKGTIKRFGYKGTDFYGETINQTWIDRLRQDISKALKKDYTIQIIQAIK